MSSELKDNIDAIIDRASRLELTTGFDESGSSSSLAFARDGEDLVFFIFNSTRHARQIAYNPRVQASLGGAGDDDIYALRVEGNCFRIRKAAEIARAREKILAVSAAFEDCMDDECLRRNDVTGFYRIKPVRISLIELRSGTESEGLEFAHNRPGVVGGALRASVNWLRLWLQALRAPFFTATLIPLLLGAIIAFGDLAAAGQAADWSWSLFWLVVIGALAAHAGTNLANDYGDHVSGNDEHNRVPSRFNGGSRVIQSGLLAPWKILLAVMLCFGLAVGIGLELNTRLAGAAFAPSPLLFIGLCGCLLGLSYTLGPWRLGYRGMGEIAIALGFGPVIVLGTHFVMSASLVGAWNWLPPLLASAPVAVFVVLIIWINQFQDLPADRLVDKRNWVVRCAVLEGGEIAYERPFELYRLLGYLGFGMVVLLSVIGAIEPRIGTLYALIALAPLPLLVYANRVGMAWLDEWNLGTKDRQRLPYELLRVNAITIGIHLSTGLLLVLAYGLRVPLSA